MEWLLLDLVSINIDNSGKNKVVGCFFFLFVGAEVNLQMSSLFKKVKGIKILRPIWDVSPRNTTNSFFFFFIPHLLESI